MGYYLGETLPWQSGKKDEGDALLMKGYVVKLSIGCELFSTNVRVALFSLLARPAQANSFVRWIYYVVEGAVAWALELLWFDAGAALLGLHLCCAGSPSENQSVQARLKD